jgi:hypothetical protein
MKTKNTPVMVLTGLAILTLASGCATFRGEKTTQGKDIAASGPTVLNAHAMPGTIELNRNLQPMRAAEVLADVKDFQSTVVDVKMRFQHVPLEIPMKNIGGTTWRAELTPRQLQMLAVSGQTMKYDVDIIAKNQEGTVGVSKSPVTLEIKSPDMATG